MMNAADIENDIMQYIRQDILGADDADLDPDENLITSGMIDSVGAMRLIAHIEATLQVKIPPTDLVPQNFRTVRVMAAYLQGLG